jgi:hypothetical protein
MKNNAPTHGGELFGLGLGGGWRWTLLDRLFGMSVKDSSVESVKT